MLSVCCALSYALWAADELLSDCTSISFRLSRADTYALDGARNSSWMHTPPKGVSPGLHVTTISVGLRFSQMNTVVSSHAVDGLSEGGPSE